MILFSIVFARNFYLQTPLLVCVKRSFLLIAVKHIFFYSDQSLLNYTFIKLITFQESFVLLLDKKIRF